MNAYNTGYAYGGYAQPQRMTVAQQRNQMMWADTHEALAMLNEVESGMPGQAAEGQELTELQRIQASGTKGGFFDCVKAFAKGAVWSSLADAVTGIHKFYKKTNVWGVLGTAAAAAVLLSPPGLAFMAAAAPVMLAAGAIMGGAKLAMGAVGVATAKTPAERVLAAKNMGRGTFDVITSGVIPFTKGLSWLDDVGKIDDKAGWLRNLINYVKPITEKAQFQNLIKTSEKIDELESADVVDDSLQGMSGLGRWLAGLNPKNIGKLNSEEFKAYQQWVNQIDEYADANLYKKAGHVLNAARYAPVKMRRALSYAKDDTLPQIGRATKNIYNNFEGGSTVTVTA